MTVTHLEMRSPADFRPSARVPEDTILLLAAEASPEFGRFLYTAVGGDWHWRDRLPWTWDDWLQRLSRPDVETWVLYCRGTPGGYFELEARGDEVQIVYFGLLPAFAGRGLGGYLLTQAVHRAWMMVPSVKRVWVHTCTLDHDAALPNYLARGFSRFAEETFEAELPDQPPGPWAGAGRRTG